MIKITATGSDLLKPKKILPPKDSAIAPLPKEDPDSTNRNLLSGLLSSNTTQLVNLNGTTLDPLNKPSDSTEELKDAASNLDFKSGGESSKNTDRNLLGNKPALSQPAPKM